MNKRVVPRQSYENAYSTARLANMELRKQATGQDSPQCPTCSSSEYVKPHRFGYIELETRVFDVIDVAGLKKEELGAPYGATYEGYDWDCPRCMIIFGDSFEVRYMKISLAQKHRPLTC